MLLRGERRGRGSDAAAADVVVGVVLGGHVGGVAGHGGGGDHRAAGAGSAWKIDQRKEIQLTCENKIFHRA